MRPSLNLAAFAVAAALSAPACADKLFAVTPSGAAEMLFAQQPTEVIGRLSSKCIDVHWTVVSSSSNELVCEAPMNFGQSLLGQLLLGNSYSTPPRRFLRFNVAQVNGISRVQASGWMELQMAFGQTKRSDFSGASFENGLMNFMGAAGGKFPVGTTFPNHVVMGFDSEDVTVGKQLKLRITKLENGMPAQNAGLQVGDLVTSVAGKTFKNVDGYLDAVAKAAETPTYDVSFVRDGKQMKVTLARAYRPTWTQVVTPAPEAAASQSAPALSVADELAKLKKLQQDGVLSEAEFEAQKKKLLGQ